MYTDGDLKLPSLIESMVCYADILGFRNKLERAFESGKGEEFLRKIKSSLDAAYEELHNDATLGDSGYAYLDTPLLDTKLFTDDIVVGYPLHDPAGDAEPELGALLILFAHAQASLAADGFLLRGGIAKGQHYQDDDIAYGLALLEAVDLNRSKSPPTVVIGLSVEPLILEHLSSYMGPAPRHDYLLEHPSDGSLFINYLGVAFEHFAEGWIIDHQLLAAHCKMVRRGLQEYESDTRIRPKYTWLATYHNYVCRSFADQFLAEGHERVDPEEIDLEAVAQSVLEHVVVNDNYFGRFQLPHQGWYHQGTRTFM